MLRVLIADDEERICQLIMALGEWDRLGLEVAGVAHNGQEALQMLEALKPDILITDIRMPGMSGLEVVSAARQMMPQLEVIIISGYAQFDYAQSALRNGVGEYLLKPINREALNLTLEKMAGVLITRRQQANDVETLRQSSQSDRERLRQKLVLDMWQNRHAPDSREQMERDGYFSVAEGVFQTFLLKIDSDWEEQSRRSMDSVLFKARDSIQPVLDRLCSDAAMTHSRNQLAGLVNLPQDRLPNLRAQLRGALNRLIAQKSMYGAVEFSLALGEACDSPAELPASFQRAREAMDERLIEGTGRLLEGRMSASGILDTDFQAHYAQAIMQAIDVLSPQLAEGAVDILKPAIHHPNLRGWELIEIVKGAGHMFITRLGAENSGQELKAFDERLEYCSDVSALLDCLRKTQLELLTQAANKRRDRDVQPIRNAKLYIQKHFTEPLTLEEVSDAIGFSVNYFSTLFKKETGEGFNKYLTKVRMDEARNLLRDTPLSVAEICAKVGYGDVKHFTKTFKNETSLTPGEYRKLYG